MRLFFVLLISIVSSQFLLSQIDIQKVFINTKLRSINENFVCTKVIDNRCVKDHVGHLDDYSKNGFKQAILEGEFETTVKQLINEIFNAETAETRIVCIVHEFYLNESYYFKTRLAECTIELEFALEQDSSLISFGKFKAIAKKSPIVPEKVHSRHIIFCIGNCIMQFLNEFETGAIDRSEFELEECPSFSYHNQKIGCYTSYSGILKNKPIENSEIEFEIKPSLYNDVKTFQINKIKSKKGSLPNRVIAFDGESYYMQSSIYSQTDYYVKSFSVGRYICFIDRAMGKHAGFVFGAVAGAFTKKNLVVLLDTKTGDYILGTKKNLIEILEEHPDLLSEYESSHRTLENLKSLFIKLNNRLTEQTTAAE